MEVCFCYDVFSSRLFLFAYRFRHESLMRLLIALVIYFVCLFSQGWHYHVASSISEWIVATIFCFYILSFTDEFKLLTFDHPTISIAGYEPIDIRITENT